MSDSGRVLGDCEHTKSREWCPECLQTLKQEMTNIIESIVIAWECRSPHMGSALNKARLFLIKQGVDYRRGYENH